MKNKIVLGTVQFGLDYGINNTFGKPSVEVAHGILDLAWENGVREIDTADAYGNSSEVLKAYFQNSPNQFKVMSKLIIQDNVNFTDAFRMSLEKLGLLKLDGYYFHRFEDFLKFKDYPAVHQLKSSGKLKALAVSLYKEEELKIAFNHPEIDVIQIPFNVFDRSENKIQLLMQAKEAGKKIYVRSIFLQGLFFMEPERLVGKLTGLKSELQQLQELARLHHMGMQELCLKYVLQKNFIDKVVIGVDTKEQLQENLNLTGGEMSPELMKDIDAIKILNTELLNPSMWNK